MTQNACKCKFAFLYLLCDWIVGVAKNDSVEWMNKIIVCINLILNQHYCAWCAADIFFFVFVEILFLSFLPFFPSSLPPAGWDNCWRWFSIRRAGEEEEKEQRGSCLKGSNRWTGRDHEGTREGCRADTESSESGFLKDFCNSQFDLGRGDRGETNGGKVEGSKRSGGKEGRQGGALTGAEETENTIWYFRKGRWIGIWYSATTMTNGPCCLSEPQKKAWVKLGAPLCGEVASTDN